MHEAFDKAREYMDDSVETWCPLAEVEDLEHTWRDGFIPHTNGGLAINLPSSLYNAWTSGSYPSQLESYIESSLKDAKEQFLKDHEWLKEWDEVDYHTLYEKGHGELAEELSGLESEWLSEGSTFWYTIKVHYYAQDNSRNESGVDEVYFMAGLNTDFEYGRDKGLDITGEKCMTLMELEKANIEEILTELIDTIWSKGDETSN